jgi:hypothetical protein
MEGRDDGGKRERGVEEGTKNCSAIVIANWLIPSPLLTYLIQKVVHPRKLCWLRDEERVGEKVFSHTSQLSSSSLSKRQPRSWVPSKGPPCTARSLRIQNELASATFANSNESAAVKASGSNDCQYRFEEQSTAPRLDPTPLSHEAPCQS